MASPPLLYVSAENATVAVLAWPQNTTGNVAPTVNIVGANTTFGNPCNIAIDAAGNLWVIDRTALGTSALFKFSPGVTGNIAPAKTFTCSTMTGARGLAFDSNGYCYVANYDLSTISIFSPALLAGAGGLIAATATLSGAATLLNAPSQVIIDSGNRIIVTNETGASVNIYAASTAGGNVAPTAQIAGANTTFGANSIESAAIDPTGRIYVCDLNNNRLEIFNNGVTGNVAPSATLTGLSSPRSICLDAANQIYVTNNGDNSVRVFAAGATGAASPIQNIVGASTLLSGNTPWGVAVWPSTAIPPSFLKKKRRIIVPPKMQPMPPIKWV